MARETAALARRPRLYGRAKQPRKVLRADGMRGVGRAGRRSGDGEVTIWSAGSAGGRCGRGRSSASIAARSLPTTMNRRRRAHQNRGVAGAPLSGADIARRPLVAMRMEWAMLQLVNLKSMPLTISPVMGMSVMLVVSALHRTLVMTATILTRA